MFSPSQDTIKGVLRLREPGAEYGGAREYGYGLWGGVSPPYRMSVWEEGTPEIKKNPRSFIVQFLGFEMRILMHFPALRINIRGD